MAYLIILLLTAGLLLTGHVGWSITVFITFAVVDLILYRVTGR